MSTLKTKRFVMRKSLIGNNTIITFTNSANQYKLETMECWHKYGNYTNSNNLPTWAREHQVETK